MAKLLWDAPETWADVAAAASWNALAAGSIVVSAAIDNTTLRRQFVEVSFETVTSTAVVAIGGHLPIYILPLLHGSTLYPNNSTSGASLPAASYIKGSIGFPAGTIAFCGSVVVPVPYGTIKIGVANRLGGAVAFPASATNMTCRYRLISEAVV